MLLSKEVFCLNRHEGYINGVFADFSARKIGLKELWNLRWHRAFDIHAAKPVWSLYPWMKNLKDY